VLSSIYPEPGMSGFLDSLIYVPTDRNEEPDYVVFRVSTANLWPTTHARVSKDRFQAMAIG